MAAAIASHSLRLTPLGGVLADDGPAVGVSTLRPGRKGTALLGHLVAATTTDKILEAFRGMNTIGTRTRRHEGGASARPAAEAFVPRLTLLRAGRVKRENDPALWNDEVAAAFAAALRRADMAIEEGGVTNNGNVGPEDDPAGLRARIRRAGGGADDDGDGAGGGGGAAAGDGDGDGAGDGGAAGAGDARARRRREVLRRVQVKLREMAGRSVWVLADLVVSVACIAAWSIPSVVFPHLDGVLYTTIVLMIVGVGVLPVTVGAWLDDDKPRAVPLSITAVVTLTMACVCSGLLWDWGILLAAPHVGGLDVLPTHYDQVFVVDGSVQVNIDRVVQLSSGGYLTATAPITVCMVPLGPMEGFSPDLRHLSPVHVQAWSACGVSTDANVSCDGLIDGSIDFPAMNDTALVAASPWWLRNALSADCFDNSLRLAAEVADEGNVPVYKVPVYHETEWHNLIRRAEVALNVTSPAGDPFLGLKFVGGGNVLQAPAAKMLVQVDPVFSRWQTGGTILAAQICFSVWLWLELVWVYWGEEASNHLFGCC